MVISDFFKALDYFGVQINFNFKSEKEYKSVCGGIIFFVYIIICIAYITINFIYFLQKKHKTVIYYDKELYTTDDIHFLEHNSTLSIAMLCDNYDGKFGEDINSKFEIKANHVKYLKIDGKSEKYKTSLTLHKCEYSDFYNQFNEELDRNEITTKHFCFNDKNYLVKGIFADKDFEYIEFILSANFKEDFDEQKYLELFYRYDCKFSLYYIDNAVDVANLTHPMRAFLNQKFIQITPTGYKKVNLFFTIKSFKSDENWFFTLPTEENYLGYSSCEEYDIEKGENRFITKYDEYEKFAKFYIRASSTRNIIERRFEKFTEFVASSTSILSAVFLFLVSILSNINESFALKEIIDTLCIEQEKNLEKKISIKANFNDNNSINKIRKERKFNSLKSEEIKNINVKIENIQNNKEEFSRNQNKKNDLIQEGSVIRENDNVYCDSTQSKMNPVYLFNALNDKKIIKKNNFLITEIKKEEEKNIQNYSDTHKNKYSSFDSNNYKDQSLSGIFNKIINKKQDKTAMSTIGPNFKLNEEQNKHNLELEYRSNKIINCNLNEKNNEKIKDNFKFLNKVIQTSILSYKYCRFFSYCKKNNKSNDLALENSLNYIIKSLDIYTYLKIIKNHDMLISILFDSDGYDLIKKLESLNLNNNIFNIGDDLYKKNKGEKRLSNTNDLELFLRLFFQLINKTNKTQMEQRLVELIIKKINDI